MKIRFRDNWGIICITSFLMVTLIYVIVNGENIYLPVHDYLDSHPAYMKMLQDNDLFCKIDATVPMLHGISRNFFYSDLKAYTWLFMIMPTFPAIVAGWYVHIIIATIGFYCLARTVYGENLKDKNLVLLCGFVYGIIPSYIPCAFAFASLPLLMALLIKLYKKFDWRYLLGLFIYPVFSDLPMMGIFVCGYILLFFIIYWFVRKKALWRMIGGLISLSFGYIITEWRLFYSMLFSAEPSIRTEFASPDASIWEMLTTIMDGFVRGQYHAGDLHMYVVFPVCISYFVYINAKYIRMRKWNCITKDKYNWIIFLLVLNSVIYGLDMLKGFKNFVATIIPPLDGFGFERAIWLNPFLWYFAFMIVLHKISGKKIKYVILFCAFCVLCLCNEMYNCLYQNIFPIAYEMIKGKDYILLTYGEFYSEELFDKILEDIDYNGEWSIAFGMHPSVLEYNGISSIDGYSTLYSLSYKRQFRQLIAPELEINEDRANYFDTWGGRAYIFSSEVGYDATKNIVSEAKMYIDKEIFREIGGKYVFSRVAVTNADELELDEIGVYTDDLSPYTIYVYEMKI